MQGDFESLLFGLLFLAVVAFQVFKQFLAARAEQRRRQQQALQARSGAQADMPQAEPDPFALTESDWGRAPEPVAPSPVPVATAPVPLEVQQALRQAASRVHEAASAATARRTRADEPRRRARHRLFHSQRALRHGIVMMTVLGPCRADKPYDRDI